MTFDEFKTIHPNAVRTTILAHSVGTFGKVVEKLNKRAAKLGINPLVVSYGEAYEFTTSVSNPESVFHGKKVNVTVIDVYASKPDVSFEGWFLKANIKHDLVTGLTLVFGGGEDAEKYRAVEPTRCDHCHVKHKRTKHFVIVKKGDEKVVGHSCLKDFVGGNGIHNAETLWNYLADLETALEGDLDEFEPTGGGSTWDNYYDLESVLEVSDAEIEENGFVPAAGNDPTKFAVLSKIAYHKKTGAAEKILADFAKYSAEDDSDFAGNLKALVEADLVSHRNIGLAVFLPEYVRRAKAKAEEAERAAKFGPSEWVGEVDTRHKFEDLEVTNIAAFDNDWGTTYYITFKDPNGNNVLWKGSSRKGLDVGDKATLVARIIEHRDHPKFGKTTVVNRPTIKEHIEADRSAS